VLENVLHNLPDGRPVQPDGSHYFRDEAFETDEHSIPNQRVYLSPHRIPSRKGVVVHHHRRGIGSVSGHISGLVTVLPHTEAGTTDFCNNDFALNDFVS
jgi:hypothetical protein